MKANGLMIGDIITFKDSLQTDETPIPVKVVALGYQHYGEENEALVQIGNDDTCDIVTIDEEFVGYPLTAEILEKNGFEICNEDADGAIQYDYGSPALGIDIWINTKPCLLGAWRTWEGETKSYTMVEELPINYIHELQHALKLCGIEKEIVL